MTAETATIDPELLWNSMPQPAFVASSAGQILTVNGAAETFLQSSAKSLTKKNLFDVLGDNSRLADLLRQAAHTGSYLVEYNVAFAWPRLGERLVDIQAAPLQDGSGALLVTMVPRAIAETIESSMTHRSAARSVAGMAATVAHEIKNPLAGIKGAAQLLEMNVGEADRELTRLIQEEATRIATLVNRVEEFGELGPPRRGPVNIHDVLDRGRLSAEAGFARHVRFLTEYDPSLPPTAGDADQLIQVIQNLLKNAAEAAPPVGGVIALRTSYKPGMKIANLGGARESLPLQVTITDNGPGVPEEIQRHIFEPFVSTKVHGTGLGLALVSKVIADHGGVVACDSRPGNTVFKLLLPIWSEAGSADADDGGSPAETGQGKNRSRRSGGPQKALATETATETAAETTAAMAGRAADVRQTG